MDGIVLKHMAKRLGWTSLNLELWISLNLEVKLLLMKKNAPGGEDSSPPRPNRVKGFPQ